MIRAAILQLPDLFVSAVIPDEEEPGPQEGSETENMEVYRCPVFMNRVSFGQPRPQGPRDIQNGGTEKTLENAGKYTTNPGVLYDVKHLILVFGSPFLGSNMAVYRI